MNPHTVGMLAGTLTTAAWLPQIARTWRSRSAEDLSWPYLLLFASGVAMWVVYGAVSGDGPVVAANVISILFMGMLVALKGHGTLRQAR